MAYIPYVVEQSNHGERSYDIFSRLLNDRIILLHDQVNSATASVVVAELLYLEGQDPDKDIYLYINSPGGSVSDGMAIYDTMQYIKCDVSTICTGMAASMGSILLCGGTQGKRSILPHSKVMIHQPLGGVSGQASDILIEAKEIEKCREDLYRILSNNCNQPYDKVFADADRNYWMTADEALEYGMVDNIIKK